MLLHLDFVPKPWIISKIPVIKYVFKQLELKRNGKKIYVYLNI